MPLIGTRGAASAQGFGEFAQSGPVNYIEDVFSTYLYTGNSSGGSNTVVSNGIDLAGKGGLVWIKQRDTGTFDTFGHVLVDSARGITKVLKTNTTGAESTISNAVASFDSSGFTAGASGYTNMLNDLYVSWTFRKQPKFFDVVTYTGDGVAGRQISHNLGSVPGCIIVKCTSGSANWLVWHRSSSNEILSLNLTDAYIPAYSQYIRNADASNFTIATAAQPSAGTVNASGESYVAYLFAHDAGGFGASGTDNVISCGSFTTDASYKATVTLGYEPQWIMYKSVNSPDDWRVVDVMRGWSYQTSQQWANLKPNTSGVESYSGAQGPTATGFIINDAGYANQPYIYIAIRRGPMKTPTSGTSVFSPATATGSGAAATITGGPTPTDFVMYLARDAGHSPMFLDRLRGSPFLNPASTSAESSPSNLYWDVMNGYRTDSNYGNYATSDVREFFKRAPSFMDVVCYTGTGSATTVTHNLTVAPELIIVKCRNQAGWNGAVYAAGSPGTLLLDQTSGAYTSGYYAGCFTSTSSTNFGVNTIGEVNGSGNTYVAWMWASCPGVSKVGSYTGTAGTQTISCGFAARFVLIKRTDSTGSWWVWDTARGMVAGTDPRLALQVANPEVNANWVYTDTSGFQIVTTDATVNASGGSYIFLAVA